MLGLTAMGYDASRPEAALRAFRMHFRGMDSVTPPGSDDASLIHCLLARKALARAQP